MLFSVLHGESLDIIKSISKSIYGVIVYKKIRKGVSYPEGFFCSGMSCGIKSRSLKDLGLIYSETPANVAALYTKNIVSAAPVKISEKITSSPDARVMALLVNSGNANAATGRKGIDQAIILQRKLASLMNCGHNEVLLASTGVIGRPFPLNKIQKSLPALIKLSGKKDKDFSESILTTDTRPKYLALDVYSKNRKNSVRIGGCAKGAGMIHPDMATMLVFITSDISCPSSRLKKMLVKSSRQSFESINVDGETSTNDSVFLLANGRSGFGLKDIGEEIFRSALNELTGYLAKSILKDAEGATRLITYHIRGARNTDEAYRFGRRVSRSLLVQTAFFGADPNWGRILSALGETGIKFNPENVDIRICGVLLYRNGTFVNITPSREKNLIKLMKNRELDVEIDLKTGVANASVSGTDISYQYVKINAEYTT